MPDQTTPTTRIFKTGATRIVEDESLRGLSIEEVRGILKRTYPEIAHATVRETTQADGTVQIDFLPQPGKKG
ncbi:MAG: hypothetical protein HY862_02745 [Chloroflexi bacterium]|nr:hypothetical protein [Chloroflexota bacterium]